MTKKRSLLNFVAILFLFFISITFMGCDQLLDFLLSNTGTTDVEITNMISEKTFYSIKLDPVDSYMLAKEATSISLAYGKTHTFSNVAEGDFKVYVKTSSSGEYLLTNGGKVLTVSSDSKIVTREVTKLTELDSTIKIVNNTSTAITTIRYKENNSNTWEEIALNVSAKGNATCSFPAGTYYIRLGYKTGSDFTTLFETTNTCTFTTGNTTTVTAS